MRRHLLLITAVLALLALVPARAMAAYDVRAMAAYDVRIGIGDQQIAMFVNPDGSPRAALTTFRSEIKR